MTRITVVASSKFFFFPRQELLSEAQPRAVAGVGLGNQGKETKEEGVAL